MSHEPNDRRIHPVTTILHTAEPGGPVIRSEHLVVEQADGRPIVVQRLDGLSVAHDDLYDALEQLADALGPVLTEAVAPAGDDEPEAPASSSFLAQRLARETVNAQHLAAKVRAITAAVDL